MPYHQITSDEFCQSEAELNKYQTPAVVVYSPHDELVPTTS